MLTSQLQLAAFCFIGAALGSATAVGTRKATFPASHTLLSKVAAEDYRRQFSQVDGDGDGKITASELAKAFVSPGEPDRAATKDGAADSTRSTKAEETTDSPSVEVPAESNEPNGLLPGETSIDERPSVAQVAQRALQMTQAAMQLAPVTQQMEQQDQGFFKHDLAFVHVPMNFGHLVERAALEGNRVDETPFILYGSFNAKSVKDQWEQIAGVRGEGGQVWGTMYPELRAVSNYSGCNLVYEPPRHWPVEFARAYFGGRRAFGLLRDPYDRLVSEFRYQASGGGKQTVDISRSEVSEREGSLEREGPEYSALYSNCDVNGWVKREMQRYKAGDQFRGNCHLLPQAEYFEHPHGISLPLDTRMLPDSFNLEMERHGYTVQLKMESIQYNGKCNKLSVWDLDEESKQLVREVYAADFDLLCRHFGYCDDEELTCLSQIPFFCGSASFMKS
mmetsp:Transcript_86097/g.208609  ORF Transcript_86097/g.208609 Transcript_86097/m.208609 type:complete len:449 (-) Transcript_86097:7-1353(-)